MGGMTGVTTALSIGASIASAMGQNRAITAQQKQLAAETSRAYAENEARRRQADRNAAEEGYQAARDGDMAASRARVRNTALGISGTTAGEQVSEEVRAGSYNVASAIEQTRDARTAQFISDRHTRATGRARMDALDSQRPGLFGTLMGAATAGLQGYQLGDRIDTARGARR